MSNAEVANRLLSLAQLLASRKENPFKVKAYRRAARTIHSMGESVEDLVHDGADLTAYAGIGKGIGAAIEEVVRSGSSRKLEALRAEARPEVAAISEYPRLDPARVLRIFKKLKISTADELKHALASGEIGSQFGLRMEQHVRQALTDSREMLLYEAGPLVASIQEWLLAKGRVRRAEV